MFALLMVVFVDSLGQGLFFPLLNTAVMSPLHGILPFDTSAGARAFYYGLIIGVFFLSWFLGATFLSTASDSVGRKRALLICLVGAFLGYAMNLVGFMVGSMTLLIVGRIVAGLTAGSQAVAQAAIIDISSKANRAKNIGLIMLAFSIGMVAGPIIGGLFSDSHLVGWFGLTTPFYVVLLIILLNIGLLQVYFKDAYVPTSKFVFKVTDAIMNFVSAFKHPKVRRLSIVFFVMQVSFNTFYVFATAYLFLKFQFNTMQTSSFMTVLGLSMAIGFGCLVAPAAKVLSAKNGIIVGLGVLALGELGYIYSHSAWMAFVLVVPMMAAFGVAYTNMLTFFSHSVGEAEQGWVMGITVSIFTLGAGLVSVFGGKLIHMNLNLPFTLSVCGLVLSVVLARVLLPSK
jgi:MFS family permease